MSELMDLFDDAKQIIEKQEKLINAQRNLIETMQMALSGIEMNELLLKNN